MSVFGFFNKVLLDIMLVDEVWDTSWVCRRVDPATSIYGAVHEEFGMVFERFVDQSFTLRFLSGLATDCDCLILE